jgi:hypothetical protein
METLDLPKDCEIRNLQFNKGKKEYQGEAQFKGLWYPFTYGESSSELKEPLKS